MIKFIDYKIVLKVISLNLFIIVAGMLSCVIVALIYSELITPFIFAILITGSIAIIFYLLSLKSGDQIGAQKRDAYLIVSLSWLSISILGSLPYLFSGTIPSFVDAIFETVSGFTTTGSSILNNIESLPKSILFWRSLTHWIGGIGIIVLVIIVMPTLQMGGYQLFSLESSLQEKIRPRIKSVGKYLLLIYILLTILEIFFLSLGGMNLFDSICHSFGTVATGGFSTKNNSLLGYSPYIQYVVLVFMFLAGTNFMIYYYLFSKEMNKVKSNDELWFYLKVVVVLGLIITGVLFFGTNKSLETSFREGFFQLISIVSCTGFATVDYLTWPQVGWVILFFALFLGGCTGSTAGGIKMARYLILIKNIKKIFRQQVSPRAIIPIRLNNTVVEEEMNSSYTSFISTYFLIFLIASLLLVSLSVDGKTAASSVATCLAGVGPGIGLVGPMNNFAHLAPLVKLILALVMLLGRLEIFTFLIIFTPSFWKK